MSPRPRQSLIATLFLMAFGASSYSADFRLMRAARHAPNNGGTRSGAAAAKRAARKRRNVRMHPRGAA